MGGKFFANWWRKLFAYCSLVPRQRTLRPQILWRKIATKPPNLKKFFPLKVSCYTVFFLNLFLFHFFSLCIYMYTGPAFNLFLRITNFSIGPFKVSKYTAPGVSTPVHRVMEEGGGRRGRREGGGRFNVLPWTIAFHGFVLETFLEKQKTKMKNKNKKTNKTKDNNKTCHFCKPEVI